MLTLKILKTLLQYLTIRLTLVRNLTSLGMLQINQKEEQEQPKTRIKKVAPASRIEYIPHGYQLSVDRRTVKRNEGLAGLHDWLKIQTAAGFLTRQETVSMIPPVVLSPEPGNSILYPR